MKTAVVIFFMLSMMLVGCGNEQSKEEQRTITVAAASDLLPAFHEIGELFEEETGISVSFSFGSTGQLADQIENGAPFDVFAAANVAFVDRLSEAGYIIKDTQQLHALGRIGIASMKEADARIENLEDFRSEKIRHISIANPAHAPYGLAAKQALETAGVWGEIENKLVYGRNISDALVQIETGNAEAGIIAYSLAIAQEEELHFTLLDEELHEPLKQAVAVVQGTDLENESRKFLTFILEGNGKTIMESYGFIVPEGN